MSSSSLDGALGYSFVFDEIVNPNAYDDSKRDTSTVHDQGTYAQQNASTTIDAIPRPFTGLHVSVPSAAASAPSLSTPSNVYGSSNDAFLPNGHQAWPSQHHASHPEIQVPSLDPSLGMPVASTSASNLNLYFVNYNMFGHPVHEERPTNLQPQGRTIYQQQAQYEDFQPSRQAPYHPQFYDYTQPQRQSYFPYPSASTSSAPIAGPSRLSRASSSSSSFHQDPPPPYPHVGLVLSPIVENANLDLRSRHPAAESPFPPPAHSPILQYPPPPDPPKPEPKTKRTKATSKTAAKAPSKAPSKTTTKPKPKRSKPYTRPKRTIPRASATWNFRLDLGDNYFPLQKKLHGIYQSEVFVCGWEGCGMEIRREMYGPMGPVDGEDYQRAVWGHVEGHIAPQVRGGGGGQPTDHGFHCHWTDCEQPFLKSSALKDRRRHVWSHGEWSVVCPGCEKYFARPDLLTRRAHKCPGKDGSGKGKGKVKAENEYPPELEWVEGED